MDWGTEERRAAAAKRGERRERWHSFWHDLPAYLLGLVALIAFGGAAARSAADSLPSLPDLPWALIVTGLGLLVLFVVWLRLRVSRRRRLRGYR